MIFVPLPRFVFPILRRPFLRVRSSPSINASRAPIAPRLLSWRGVYKTAEDCASGDLHQRRVDFCPSGVRCGVRLVRDNSCLSSACEYELFLIFTQSGLSSRYSPFLRFPTTPSRSRRQISSKNCFPAPSICCAYSKHSERARQPRNQLDHDGVNERSNVERPKKGAAACHCPAQHDPDTPK